MNVITFGDETSAYCETVCGGAGAVSNRCHKSLRCTTFHTINFYREAKFTGKVVYSKI